MYFYQAVLLRIDQTGKVRLNFNFFLKNSRIETKDEQMSEEFYQFFQKIIQVSTKRETYQLKKLCKLLLSVIFVIGIFHVK